jgi:uncharacterized small protein (DUF1192 family)
MSSDLVHRRGRRPDACPFPAGISKRLCAEFAAKFCQALDGGLAWVAGFAIPRQGFSRYLSRAQELHRLTGGPPGTKIWVAEEGDMPAIDPDELPKKKITHEMGQDLALLSVAELTERIGLLKEEILRLEGEMTRKRASKSAADTFFKK